MRFSDAKSLLRLNKNNGNIKRIEPWHIFFYIFPKHHIVPQGFVFVFHDFI